jgi:hypothetical protein
LEKDSTILSLPELALQYGTITDDQFQQINKIQQLHHTDKDSVDWAELMLKQRMATSYQVGLLKLIQEYLILKKRGEEFGKMVVEKGFATREDVKKALDHQKKEFKRAKVKKLIGDILVESRVITVKQRNAILKEQTFLDAQSEKIFSTAPEKKTQPVEDALPVALSKYDRQFLQIKALDQEFAASVIEKGLASKREVGVAQKVQEDAFEKDQTIKMLGDIMVDLNQITPEQKNLVLMEQSRLDEQKELEVSSGIHISISPDKMEAQIIIKESRKEIGLQDIKTALSKKGICLGIYPDALLQCHLDQKSKSFIAARQDCSIELIKDRKAVYHFNVNTIDPEQKEKGATLAEQVFGSDVHVKKDVFGNNIEQLGRYDFTFRCGPGTRFSKDKTKAFAGKTGFPSLSIERKLYVHPSISVLEDADLKYGPLERYANLNVLGVLTGAYPVTAGNVDAREIRGANIKSIGNVASKIGITEAMINAQGDVHARYIHNSIVYAFGNVIVENEIIDSRIYCSGQIKSPGCKVISSDLFGKKGVELAGAGNDRTRPCVIGAGTEHHILEMEKLIQAQIQAIRAELDGLIEKRDEQAYFENKTFQKMVELKLFHDRAKKKKEILTKEFHQKKDSLKKSKIKNIARLLNNFKNRMAASVSSLKELNLLKKKYEKKKNSFQKKIDSLEPKIEKEISSLKIDLISFFEWTKKQRGVAEIKISGDVFSDTQFQGVYSRIEISEMKKNVCISEKRNEKNVFDLYIQKI